MSLTQAGIVRGPPRCSHEPFSVSPFLKLSSWTRYRFNSPPYLTSRGPIGAKLHVAWNFNENLVIVRTFLQITTRRTSRIELAVRNQVSVSNGSRRKLHEIVVDSMVHKLNSGAIDAETDDLADLSRWLAVGAGLHLGAVWVSRLCREKVACR